MAKPDIHKQSENPETDPRRFTPSFLRNRDPILEVLQSILCGGDRVLEVASGTGEHCAYFLDKLHQGISWQPTDFNPETLPSIDAHVAKARNETGTNTSVDIAPAVQLDVTKPDWQADFQFSKLYCANMIHIAPWEAACGMLEGAGKGLPKEGKVILYGPYRRNGQHIAQSNQDFDQNLKSRDPSWGIRDLEQDVVPQAEKCGLQLASVIDMPNNNFIVVLNKP